MPSTTLIQQNKTQYFWQTIRILLHFCHHHHHHQANSIDFITYLFGSGKIHIQINVVFFVPIFNFLWKIVYFKGLSNSKILSKLDWAMYSSIQFQYNENKYLIYHFNHIGNEDASCRSYATSWVFWMVVLLVEFNFNVRMIDLFFCHPFVLWFNLKRDTRTKGELATVNGAIAL